MKAILLATGEQKKLPPITDLIPSPLISVANKPVMEHAIEMLARQAVRQMWVSLNYLPGAVEGYFKSGLRWGVALEYLLQRDALGTAGALKWAQSSLDMTFLVLPADTLIDLDVQAALEQHQSQGNIATLIASQYGYRGCAPVYLDDQDRMVRAEESSPSAQPWYGTGAYLFEPEALEYIPGRAVTDIQSQLLPLLIQNKLPVGSHRMSGYWNPLGSFEEYQQAQETLLHAQSGMKTRQGVDAQFRYLRLNARQVSPGIWIGRNSAVHPSARLTPPVLIGENTQVGRNVELGPDTVIGSSSIVDTGATVRESTVLEYTYVGQMVNVQKRMVVQNQLIDMETAQTVRIVDPFLLDSLKNYSAAQFWIRAVDMLGALILLIVTLPLSLPLALLAWIDTGRPFETYLRARQLKDWTRTPRASQARFFRLVRFSTHRKDGSATRLSRAVKSRGLARIPELWNVVKGDMGLVGVHPLSPEDITRVSEAWQVKLREIKPGFTGLWYIENIEESDPMALQVADAYYAATRTWMKDMALILKTPGAWLKRRRWGEIAEREPGEARAFESSPVKNQ